MGWHDCMQQPEVEVGSSAIIVNHNGHCWLGGNRFSEVDKFCQVLLASRADLLDNIEDHGDSSLATSEFGKESPQVPELPSSDLQVHGFEAVVPVAHVLHSQDGFDAESISEKKPGPAHGTNSHQWLLNENRRTVHKIAQAIKYLDDWKFGSTCASEFQP